MRRHIKIFEVSLTSMMIEEIQFKTSLKCQFKDTLLANVKILIMPNIGDYVSHHMIYTLPLGMKIFEMTL